GVALLGRRFDAVMVPRSQWYLGGYYTIRARIARGAPARPTIFRAQGRDLMAHVPLHPLWSSLALDRLSGVSLQDQIANFFRDGIVAGRIQRGRRVPSTRQLAVEHGVSRTTAVEAYERLIAEGYLVSSQGAGVFVAESLPEDLQRK